MGFQWKFGRRRILIWLNNVDTTAPHINTLQTLLSRQHFKAEIKVKISLKRKQWRGWETVLILANIFSTHHKLGLSGKVTGFLGRNILEVVRNGGRDTLRRFLVLYLELRSQRAWKSQRAETSMRMGSGCLENTFRKYFLVTITKIILHHFLIL